MRSSRVHLRGFTLIELIFVMIIMAIGAALVAPSLIAFEAGRANNDSATLILSLAGYARTQSVSEGRTYRLNVDPARKLVWLTAGNAGVFSGLANDYGKDFPIASGSQMTTDIVGRTDGQYVEFQSTGRTEPAKIWLTDKYDRTIEVACEAATEAFHIVPAAEMSK